VCQLPAKDCPTCTGAFESYLWFKFEVTAIRGGGNDGNFDTCGFAGCMQFSELELYGSTTDTSNPFIVGGATNPGGSSPGGEGQDNAVDGNVQTKFLDSTFTDKTAPATSPVIGSSVGLYKLNGA
jgi:hypothetical protein